VGWGWLGADNSMNSVHERNLQFGRYSQERTPFLEFVFGICRYESDTESNEREYTIRKERKK
jgi:hypothetical protein